jgi:hypothetical protein
MRSVLGIIAAAAVLQIIGAQPGYSARILSATETTGLPGGDLTSAFDSGFGPVCSTANEDLSACFGTPYSVSPSFLTAAAAANGAVVGVNLIDGLNTDTPGQLSDQLYLRVGAAAGGAQPTLTWCWDSDLEPNVNICQQQITVPAANLFTVTEPVGGGTIDLTSFFAGPNGPLAGGGVWQVTALSEVPEPASLALFGSALAGFGLLYRRRKSA